MPCTRRYKSHRTTWRCALHGINHVVGRLQFLDARGRIPHCSCVLCRMVPASVLETCMSEPHYGKDRWNSFLSAYICMKKWDDGFKVVLKVFSGGLLQSGGHPQSLCAWTDPKTPTSGLRTLPDSESLQSKLMHNCLIPAYLRGAKLR